jgi:predicted PurR-regulated permease PerM
VTGIQKQVTFWLVAAIALLALVFVLREILLPFVFGLAIAYFLDPVADRLERIGFSRIFATVLIIMFFSAGLLVFFITTGPLLIRQLVALAGDIPGYIDMLYAQINLRGQQWFGPEFSVADYGMGEALRDIGSKYASSTPELLRSIWSGSMAFFNFLALLLVTPVVAFYMLYDWDRMLAVVDSLLPRDNLGTIRNLASRVDTVIAGFVRGQVLVCLILGVFSSLCRVVIGLDYGLLIGLGAGILSFIPFIGASSGFLVGGLVAFSQFWPGWLPVAMVIGVFTVGQIIEGYFLTPNIIGDKVKLHPVWLVFSLFVFGYLMGFLGMLIAVPLAGAIGVLVRFSLDRYVQSQLFYGQGKKPER